MEPKTLVSLADDPNVAGPIGLLVCVAADMERVQKEIFGDPLRALARAFRIRPKPNYDALLGSLQFDQVILGSILSDLKVDTAGYNPAPVLDATLNCLQALMYAIERLIRIVRSKGKIEKLSFWDGGGVMGEYDHSMKYVHSNRALLPQWSACRADERSMSEYLLRVVASTGFEQRSWDVVDPEIAEMMRRFSGTLSMQ